MYAVKLYTANSWYKYTYTRKAVVDRKLCHAVSNQVQATRPAVHQVGSDWLATLPATPPASGPMAGRYRTNEPTNQPTNQPTNELTSDSLLTRGLRHLPFGSLHVCSMPFCCTECSVTFAYTRITFPDLQWPWVPNGCQRCCYPCCCCSRFSKY